MATLDELLNGAQPPAPLPQVNPEGLVQAGSNMATMGAQPTPVTNPQAQPPATPEEFNARKNGWMQALEQLRADPAAQQAMMFAASRMLNGPRFGQSQGGAIGEAAFGGMSMYNQLKENAEERGLKQREADRRDQLVGADIGLRQAQTGEVQQRTTESAAKMPIEMDKLRLDAKRANLELAIKEIETKVAQGIDVPTQIKQKLDKMKLELAAVQANINQSNAAAGASGALAAERREATKWIKPKALADISQTLSGTAENLADTPGKLGGEGGSKGGATAAVVQGREDAYRRLASVNPSWRPDQINAEILRSEKIGKGKPDRQFLIDAQKVWVEAKYADIDTPEFSVWYEQMFGEQLPGREAATPKPNPNPGSGTGNRKLDYNQYLQQQGK